MKTCLHLDTIGVGIGIGVAIAIAVVSVLLDTDPDGSLFASVFGTETLI